MSEAIKLLLPFIYTPRNYDHVLRKLASFAFYEVYVITFLLREDPKINAWFLGVESWGQIGNVVRVLPYHDTINLSGFAIALLIAILTNVFQFHDRLSDIFGIREKFDIEKILIPLAFDVGVFVTEETRAKIAKHRDVLMHAVFYRYASSRAQESLVDKHDIEHALNAWSWYWVFVEAVTYFGLGLVIAWLFGLKTLSLVFLITVIAASILGVLQRSRLSRYARPQIETIASHPEAASDVRERFNAL